MFLLARNLINLDKTAPVPMKSFRNLRNTVLKPTWSNLSRSCERDAADDTLDPATGWAIHQTPSVVGMVLEMNRPNVAPYVWAAALIAVAIWGVSGTPQMAHTSANTHLARSH